MLAVFGESAHYIESVKSLNSSIANAMRTFSKKNKYLNIVLRTFQSSIQNCKRAFRKFGKFEERSSKILEIRKLEVISNEWTPCPQSFQGSYYLCIGCYHAAGIVLDCVKIFLLRVNSSVGWQQVSPILSSLNPSVSHSPAISQIIKQF